MRLLNSVSFAVQNPNKQIHRYFINHNKNNTYKNNSKVVEGQNQSQLLTDINTEYYHKQCRHTDRQKGNIKRVGWNTSKTTIRI